MKVPLGTFARNGIETCLAPDVPAGVIAALADFTVRLRSGAPPAPIPRLPPQAAEAEPALSVELPVDEGTWDVLRLEAARQGVTVSQLAAHSVLVYLAELDRLTPPDSTAAA